MAEEMFSGTPTGTEKNGEASGSQECPERKAGMGDC